MTQVPKTNHQLKHQKGLRENQFNIITGWKAEIFYSVRIHKHLFQMKGNWGLQTWPQERLVLSHATAVTRGNTSVKRPSSKPLTAWWTVCLKNCKAKTFTFIIINKSRFHVETNSVSCLSGGEFQGVSAKAHH